MLNQIEIARGVYYVGAVDWNLRDFHGYNTPRGVTYNSYLIVDEKICLIDNVKAPYSEELLERVSQIVDLAKIDYVITNHVEPDHSGSLPKLMERAPQAKVVLTNQGRDEVIKYYGKEYDFMTVKQGDVLDIGRNKLHFVPLPMLHWPDSMATFMEGENILFSNDAFGQHFCTSKRFDDENELPVALYEAAKYYANILMPFGKLVVRALDKVSSLPLSMIAPSHGLIWRSHIKDILSAYKRWGSGENRERVVIVYDTMWGSTEQMARRILDGVASTGVEVRLMRISTTELSDVALAVLEAGGILLGSSAHNSGPLATMAAASSYLQGLKPQNKLGGAFGAFGWNGGAQERLEAGLAASGITAALPSLFLKWTADKAELQQCFEFGQQFGEKVKEANRKD